MPRVRWPCASCHPARGRHLQGLWLLYYRQSPGLFTNTDSPERARQARGGRRSELGRKQKGEHRTGKEEKGEKGRLAHSGPSKVQRRRVHGHGLAFVVLELKLHQEPGGILSRSESDRLLAQPCTRNWLHTPAAFVADLPTLGCPGCHAFGPRCPWSQPS